MGVKEELEWLYSLHSKGIKLGLERVNALVEKLGNPLSKFQVIHIAGTNGKGSVGAMLYNILRQAGFSVGLYTSPHLVKFNERIVVDDEEITEAEIVELTKLMKKQDVEATFFEFTTVMALMHFANKGVKYAVIETGMGGRLDATNIVKPVLSIITKISMDHQQYLGDTLEKIAREKAGIIKQEIPVITSNAGIPLEVIREVANARQAEVITLDNIKVREVNGKWMEYQEAVLESSDNTYEIKTRLLGKHQLMNVATAIAAAERLGMCKRPIQKGINHTQWPARLEVVSRQPLVILDGSHNVEGFRNLSEFIEQNLNHVTLVMGISFDKDIEAMIPLVAPLVKRIIVCKGSLRGASTAELRAIAEKYNPNIEEIESPREAIEKALSEAQLEDTVLVSGSLYVAGEIKEWLDSLD